MTDHDGTYHLLFSHPPMVEDLIRSFIEETWVADLDFSRMERTNTKFHADNKKRREEDVIWCLPTHSGSPVYLYFPIGFQSDSPRLILTRVGAYIFLLWQHLEKENKLPASGKLPPVFPIIIYNADPTWTAPTQLYHLIDLPEDSPLWAYQPTLRYYLIDEGRFSPEELVRKNSFSALVFLLEHCKDPNFFPKLIDLFIEWFKNYPQFVPLKKVITTMIREVIYSLSQKLGKHILNIPDELREIKTMLMTRIEGWLQDREQKGMLAGEQKGMLDGEQKGMLAGEQKGKQDGLREGEANILLRQLTRRVGHLPSWVHERVKSADLDTLELWSDRVLDAHSLEDVFGPNPTN